jgi:NAD(P)-dependent dehydrogenase (short-subunit alcohol dehydrogenase family)
MSRYGASDVDFPPGAAIVFGGSGGLGAPVARLLAERGTDVSLTYHGNKSAAEGVAKEIEDLGRRAHIQQVDLADQASIRGYMDEVAESFGGIHSMVFAAGPMLAWNNVAELDVEQFWKFVEIDVKGFYIAAQAVIPHLRASEGGSIVALGTIAQERYLTGDIASSAPKGAVLEIVRAISREEGPAGVRANFVLVGGFEAGMGLTLLETTPKEFLDAMLASTPLSRWGRPEELAEVITFLASNRSSFVSGQSFAVDGGFTV